MADYTDVLMVKSAEKFGLTNAISGDTITSNASWTFGTDVTIDGDLVVNGTTTTIDTETLLVEDNNIFLSSNYTTVAAKTAGLTANYLPIATTDTVAATGFTTAGGGNPTVNTTSAANFAVGQFILITGANTSSNNGLYEVLTHAANLLTVRGGSTALVEDFTQGDFVTDTVVAGSITRLNVSVMRAGDDGLWEVGSGAVTGISFSDVQTGASSVTLDDAYNNGNTITTDGTGNVIVAGTQALQISATNGLNVDTVVDLDLTSYDLQMTGSNGFSMDGTAASNVSVTAGNLSLETLSSGTLILSAVAAATLDSTTLSIDSTDATNLSMTANVASPRTLTIEAINNDGGGTGNLDINVDDALTMDAGAGFSIDGSGAASNLSSTSQALTVSTLTSGTLTIDAVALLDINAGANMDVDVTGTYDLLVTSTIDLASTGTTDIRATSGNLNLRTFTTGDVNIAAVDTVDIDGDAIQIDANGASTGSVSIDANISSNFNIAASTAGTETLTMSVVNGGAGTGAILISASQGGTTLRTVSSGTLLIDAVAVLDIDAASMDLDASGNFDLLAGGTVSIDGTGNSNLSATSGNLSLQTLTTGTLILSSIAAATLDSTTLSIDSTDATNFSMTASVASPRTLTIEAINNDGGGTGNLDINVDDALTMDAGAGFSIDGAAASNLSTTSSNLTVSTLSTGTLAINAVALLDIDSGFGIDIDVTGNFDMLATGTFSIDGTGNSNVSATSGALTLSSLTSGNVAINSVNDVSITFQDPSATGFTLTDGTSDYIVADSTAGLEQLNLDQLVNLVEGAGVAKITGTALVAGNLVSMESLAGGDFLLSDANAGTIQTGICVGVARGTFADTDTAQVFTVPGSIIPILFTGGAPAASENGHPCYVSTTAGAATLTMPASDDDVSFLIGYLEGADGALTTVPVLFQPHLIAVGANVV